MKMKWLYVTCIILFIVNIASCMISGNSSAVFGWLCALAWCINCFMVNNE